MSGFFSIISEKVVDITATFLVFLGFFSPSPVILTETVPAPRPQIDQQTEVRKNVPSPSLKEIENLKDIQNLLDAGCLDDIGTSSPLEFSMPVPVLIDKYREWNFFRYDQPNNEGFISFYYPKTWDVQPLNSEVFIYSKDKKVGFYISKTNFTQDSINNFLRGCYRVAGPLHIDGRSLNGNIDFRPILVDGDVVFVFYNKNIPEWYVLRGPDSDPMYITRFTNQESLDDATVREIMSTYNFKGGDEMPTSSEKFMNRGSIAHYHKELASPDGKYVAVTDAGEDSSATYIKDSQGNIISKKYFGYFVMWSPDSKKLLVDPTYHIFNGLRINYYIYPDN